MQSTRKHTLLFVVALAVVGVLFLEAPPASAQGDDSFNPPPCDYNDTFYMDNGIDPTQLQGRFGTSRQFGPPARTRDQAN